MPYVVFLRAANVGGKNVFRPAQLAAALAHLDVVNVGAAGTFLVRERASTTLIRHEILSRLKFETEIAIVPTREILALARSEPFSRTAFSKDQRRWVGILCRRTSARPDLPIATPPGKLWSVRLDSVEGSFALGLWRRRPSGFVFPNQVVEKALGVPATTRWWETILRLVKLIEG